MDYINNVTVFSLEMATVRDPIFSPFPDVYFPNGESPKNVSEVTFPVFRSRTLMVVTSPRWLIGDVGVGVFQNATKAASLHLRVLHLGLPQDGVATLASRLFAPNQKTVGQHGLGRVRNRFSN